MTTQKRNPTLAFLAGSLLCLAGLIDGLIPMWGRHDSTRAAMRHGDVAVAAAFLCAGLLWLVIGVRWKRESRTEERPKLP